MKTRARPENEKPGNEKLNSRFSLTLATFINFFNLLHAFYFPYRSILVSFDDNDVKVNYGFDPRITLDESATTNKNEVENLYGDKKYGAKKYDKKAKIPSDIDHFFLLIMSIIIFFMQCGFAFMEAGAVR